MRNKLASIFIGIFPVAAILIAGLAIYRLAADLMDFVWWGALLVSLPILLLFIRAMALKDVARTSANLPVIQGLAMIGLAQALYMASRDDTLPLGAALTLAGFLLLTAYIHWYSRLGRMRSRHLVRGARLPDLQFRDSGGNVVKSSRYLGQCTLFLFYRGNWCPFCMAQIDELADRYRDLQDLGIKPVMISPQPQDKTAALAARHNLDIDFLVDEDNAAARQLGIVHDSGLPLGLSMLGYSRDTVMPTVIITDAAGKVIYANETDNYRVRPAPDVFLRIVRENRISEGQLAVPAI